MLCACAPQGAGPLAASGLAAGCSRSACAAAAGCARRRRCRRSAQRGGRVLGAPRRPGAAAARAADAASGSARRPTDAALLGGLPGPLAVPSRPPRPLPLLLCPRPCPPPCLSCPRSPAGRPWPIRPSPPPRSLRTSRTASRSRPLTPRQGPRRALRWGRADVPGEQPPAPGRRGVPGQREQRGDHLPHAAAVAWPREPPWTADPQGSGPGCAARGVRVAGHAAAAPSTAGGQWPATRASTRRADEGP